MRQQSQLPVFDKCIGSSTVPCSQSICSVSAHPFSTSHIITAMPPPWIPSSCLDSYPTTPDPLLDCPVKVRAQQAAGASLITGHLDWTWPNEARPIGDERNCIRAAGIQPLMVPGLSRIASCTASLCSSPPAGPALRYEEETKRGEVEIAREKSKMEREGWLSRIWRTASVCS